MAHFGPPMCKMCGLSNYQCNPSSGCSHYYKCACCKNKVPKSIESSDNEETNNWINKLCIKCAPAASSCVCCGECKLKSDFKLDSELNSETNTNFGLCNYCHQTRPHRCPCPFECVPLSINSCNACCILFVACTKEFQYCGGCAEICISCSELKISDDDYVGRLNYVKRLCTSCEDELIMLKNEKVKHNLDLKLPKDLANIVMFYFTDTMIKTDQTSKRH